MARSVPSTELMMKFSTVIFKTDHSPFPYKPSLTAHLSTYSFRTLFRIDSSKHLEFISYVVEGVHVQCALLRVEGEVV